MSDKRARILKAARERFRRFGIKKTSMREIAADADLAVGTLYLYFKNKDAIVLAFVDEFRAVHKAQSKHILGSDEPAAQRLRQYLLSRYRASEATREGTPFAEQITAAVLRCCPDRLHEEGEAMHKTLVRLLKEGFESGEFQLKDPAHDAEVLLYAIAWFFPVKLHPASPRPTEEGFLKVVDWFLLQWRGER